MGNYYACFVQTGKTNLLGVLKHEEIVVAKLSWRGFKQGVFRNLVAYKLLSPRRYLLERNSQYSSGSLLPVKIEPQDCETNDIHQTKPNIKSENDEVIKTTEPVLTDESGLKKIRPRIPPRNLNEIAFSRKQDLSSDYRSLSRVRLNMFSKLNLSEPTSQYNKKQKHQFKQQEPDQLEVVFTDELSVVDEDFKQKLNPRSPPQQQAPTLNKSLISKSDHTPHHSKSLDRFPLHDIGLPNSANKHSFGRVEKAHPAMSMERTMQVFRNKARTSSGVVSADKKSTSPLQSVMTGKKDLAGVGKGVVRSLTGGQLRKNTQRLYACGHSQADSRMNGEHMNPEIISASHGSITSTKFQDFTPRFRIKRDLVSVVMNTTRIPIINRKTPKFVEKVTEDFKMEFTPIQRSSMPDSKQQKLKLIPDPPVRTWNFAPRRSRVQPTPTLNKKYSYKYVLNPSGTTLRQTVVLKTPKISSSNESFVLSNRSRSGSTLARL